MDIQLLFWWFFNGVLKRLLKEGLSMYKCISLTLISCKPMSVTLHPEMTC